MKQELKEVKEALKFYANPPEYKVSTPYVSGEPFKVWDDAPAKEALTKLDGIIERLCGDALKDTSVCGVCGDLATVLCDYPVGNDKTCDSALCDKHSHSIIRDIHYCNEHATEQGKVIYLVRQEQYGSGI